MRSLIGESAHLRALQDENDIRIHRTLRNSCSRRKMDYRPVDVGGLRRTTDDDDDDDEAKFLPEAKRNAAQLQCLRILMGNTRTCRRSNAPHSFVRSAVSYTGRCREGLRSVLTNQLQQPGNVIRRPNKRCLQNEVDQSAINLSCCATEASRRDGTRQISWIRRPALFRLLKIVLPPSTLSYRVVLLCVVGDVVV